MSEELEELRAIKKLLILLLRKHEVPSEAIGNALGLSGRAVRNISPGRKRK